MSSEHDIHGGHDLAFPFECTGHTGLSKRELFAAMAMQGQMTHLAFCDAREAPEYAQAAVTFADALIAELAK